MDKAVLKQRAKDFLAQTDACELALQRITRHRDQVKVLRKFAVACGRESAFDRLKPSQVGSLLAKAKVAAEGITRHIVAFNSAMSAELDKVVKP